MQAADARKVERTEANQKVENEVCAYVYMCECASIVLLSFVLSQISLLRSAIRKVGQDSQKMPDEMMMDTGGGKRG